MEARCKAEHDAGVFFAGRARPLKAGEAAEGSLTKEGQRLRKGVEQSIPRLFLSWAWPRPATSQSEPQPVAWKVIGGQV